MKARHSILFSAALLSMGAASAQTAQESTPAGWSEFARVAIERHGEVGAQAVAFLSVHRPERDAELPADLLIENLDLALAARDRFRWARTVPLELFLNDVLPYAVLDETRERWRPALLEHAAPLVAECKTATEAAQALNRGLFDAIGVHYDTGRKAPNQSPFESREQGRATCTGLSILLVDACRAVGIPARAAGVAQWHDDRGNHTWTEIWDGEWHFTGADEYDAAGLDRAWFTGDAAKATADDETHAVWAGSWRATGARFPLSWSPDDSSVNGVDVTARYARTEQLPVERAVRRIRVWDRRGGERLVARARVVGPEDGLFGEDVTRAGRSDLNDAPAFALALGAYTLQLRGEGWSADVPLDATESGSRTLDLYRTELAGLSRLDAEARVAKLWDEARTRLAADCAAELEAKEVRVEESALRFDERVFGEAPERGHSLWISLHGGGGAPTEVNDSQWKNQLRLYEPEEGIYVAPRAPGDTWDLWHRSNVDPLLARLIEAYVSVRGVDPDRVYLLGYSAGGDGVYQLAPRSSDRFAAASAMAGHPNEARTLGLRNLPFAIFVGGKDTAYDRNAVAARWGAELDELQSRDPDGYPHRLTIYPDHGHWMQGEDREALPWMAQQTRRAWPKRVVWVQDDVVHTRSYWLRVEPEDAVVDRLIVAEVQGRTIRIQSERTRALTLLLRDELIDLDEPLVVEVNGARVFRGVVPRREAAIRSSLAERADPRVAATATLDLRW